MRRMSKDMRELRTPGFAWRVSLSIIVFFGWIIFQILWLFFYASDYTIYQNVAIFLVSILVPMAIMAAAWASWGMKFAARYGRRRR